jgi:hypothetical protein
MVMTTFCTQRARVHRKERLARQREALKVQKLDFFSSFLALDWIWKTEVHGRGYMVTEL